MTIINHALEERSFTGYLHKRDFHQLRGCPLLAPWYHLSMRPPNKTGNTDGANTIYSDNITFRRLTVDEGDDWYAYECR